MEQLTNRNTGRNVLTDLKFDFDFDDDFKPEELKEFQKPKIPKLADSQKNFS
jgi:hypothetical protein